MTKKHNRHSIRLRTWDYSSSGYYFLTICSYKRECIFGDVVGGEMRSNEYGEILNDIINSLSNRFNIKIDIYQIMPNHLHIVIFVGAHHDAPKLHHTNIQSRAIHESPLHRHELSKIVGYLKMNVSKSIHQISPNQQVWQRNYYEHIIRNEAELVNIRKYIINNPLKWDSDKNNPVNL
ncbi:transposase [Candidatus Microgenomates bacterium]|nr:MAG: transposase [Candidatus Microgenomates bacterium]